MTNSPNPHYISQNANGSSMTQPVDTVDFPHSGLIKSLNQMAAGNVVVKTGTDFDINQTGGNLVVAAGKILRNGKYHEIATKNFADSSLTTTYDKGYHLLVVADGREGGETVNELYVRPPTAANRVPEFKLGDTIVAMIEYSSGTSAGSRLIQYFTTNKESNSLSIAYANSNVYTQAMTVDADSDGDVTFENVVDDKDIIFKVSDGGTPTEVMRVDGSTSNVGIGATAPTAKLEVKGNATLSRSADSALTTILTVEGARNATGSNYAQLDFKNYDSNGPTSYVGARIAAKNEADGVNDGSLTFSTNNANAGITEKMRITDDGKVGIGTDSPSSVLHVKGASNPTIRVQETGQTGHAELTAVVDSQTRLKAINNTSSEPITFDISPVCTATGTDQILRIFRDSQSAVDGNFRINRVGTTASVFHVYSDKDGTDHKMTMDGKVGIGTTSPDTALHVKGQDAVLSVEDTSIGIASLSRTMAGINIVSAGMNAGASQFGSAVKFLSSDPQFTTENPKFLAAIVPRGTETYDHDIDGGMALDFAITDNAQGATNVPVVKMTIDHTGNVGIGTDEPSTSLEIQDGLTTTGAVLTLSTKEPSVVANDVLGQINFQAPLDTGADSDLVGASIQALATDTFSDTVNATDLILKTGASETATEKMRITSAGNVGIGNTNPAATLDVTGSIAASTTINGDMVTGATMVTGGMVRGLSLVAGPIINATTEMQIDGLEKTAYEVVDQNIAPQPSFFTSIIYVNDISSILGTAGAGAAANNQILMPPPTNTLEYKIRNIHPSNTITLEGVLFDNNSTAHPYVTANTTITLAPSQGVHLQGIVDGPVTQACWMITGIA